MLHQAFTQLFYREQAVKRLLQAKVNLRGILFNDVLSHSRIYGAGKYHYQFSYK